MSTLVSILFAMVMNTLSGGNVQAENQDVSDSVNYQIEIQECQEDIQNLNPHFIITEDELSSYNQ